MTRRADWFDDGDLLPQLGGDASFVPYPDDIAMFTDDERDQWRAELAAKEARRRPPGFAAWPDAPDVRLRVVS